MMKRSKRINLHDYDELKRIISEKAFQSMKELPHHGSVSCYEHSILVAQIALYSAKKRGLDYISAAAGGLLHDLYLYHKKSIRGSVHRVTHPETALVNAEKYFTLNDIIRDAIVNHMWPLTPVKPKFRESMIVSHADKASAIDDYRRNAGINFKRLYHNRLY